MSTLYELSNEYLQLLEMLEDDVDEQVFKDTLEGIEGEIEIKADGYAKVMKQLEGEVEMIKGEIERLTSRKKTIENNISRLKDSLKGAMEITGKTKFKTELFSFAIQKNGGKAPVIWDVPVEDLPEELVKVTYSPDNAAAFELLQTMNSDFCHLGERGESLRIK